MNAMAPSKNRGFTLIELLVVVAIIALLSSVVVASVSKSRQRSQDSQRMGNLQQVRTALEFYANANGGSYPGSGPDWRSQCSSWIQASATDYVPGLVAGGYIPRLPTDPQQDASSDTCCYMYASGNTDPGDGGTRNYKYMLYNCGTSFACYQNTNAGRAFRDPARPSSCAIYTPGAALW